MAVGSEASWSFDGTQPPPPLKLYPDPLAGLVTGESNAGADPMPGRYDDIFVPIARPVEVDRDSSVAMMEAVLSEDDDEVVAARPKAAPAQSSHAGRAFLPNQRGRQRPPTGPALPGMLPPPDRQPAGQRVRQALRSYPHPQRRQAAQQQAPAQQRRKPSRSASGVIIALILIAVFGIIAFQVLAGILEALSGLVE